MAARKTPAKKTDETVNEPNPSPAIQHYSAPAPVERSNETVKAVSVKPNGAWECECGNVNMDTLSFCGACGRTLKDA